MELKQSWKMIYMNETARRSLMIFGDNVITIDLDFDMLCHIKGGEMDKRSNELAMVVKDIRALRDSFEPWLDEVWWKFAWTEIKNSSVKKYKSEQFRTWKDLDRETIFVYSINSFWIR